MELAGCLYLRALKCIILEAYSILPGVLAFVADISSRYNALRLALCWTEV
jgi:hypothetical protein